MGHQGKFETRAGDSRRGSLLRWTAFAWLLLGAGQTLPAVDGAALSPVPKGTPEEPFVAPPPAGAPASRLQGVEVVERGGETLVRIKGDGEFAYQSFQLEDPPRFVVDLDGAVKTETDSSLAVGSVEVERIRMAQYKSEPDPVARVVFDLRSDSQPWIGRDPQGLLVRFDNGSPATAARVEPSRTPSHRRAESAVRAHRASSRGPRSAPGRSSPPRPRWAARCSPRG